MTTPEEGAGVTPAPSAAAGDDAPQYGGFSDEILADIDLAGAPVLRQLHQLDRRSRAQLIRAVKEVLPRADALDDYIKDGGKLDDDALTVDVAEFLADVEDVLAAVAVDRPAFRKWAGQADDQHLLGLFAKLAGDLRTGEAPSSSS